MNFKTKKSIENILERKLKKLVVLKQDVERLKSAKRRWNKNTKSIEVPISTKY